MTGRFQKGQSGNPEGRKKGNRNKATLALESLLDKDGRRLTRKAIELALAGDMQALRLCMDRILPVRRDRHVSIQLPAIETPADAVKASAAIASAISAGEITPSEAAELAKVIEAYVRSVEIHDIAERLSKLEAKGTNH